MLAAAVLAWSLVAVAPPATEAPAPEPSNAEPSRTSIRGGWLAIHPVGYAAPAPGRDIAGFRQAVGAGFRWGFSVGVSVEPTRGLFISASAGFDQVLWIFRNYDRDGYSLCFGGDCYGWDERVVGHLIRIGPQLRIGWTHRRMLVWAMGTAQLAISRLRLDCNNSVEDHCGRSSTDIGPSGGGGLGLAVRITPACALGVEGSVQHSAIDRREDPFRAIRTAELALILALRF